MWRPEGEGSESNLSSSDLDRFWQHDELQEVLYALEPPELPQHLSPGQAAQLAELLEYMHIRMRQLVNSVKPGAKSDQVLLHYGQWQNLVEMQFQLADYRRTVGDPDDHEEHSGY